ncbi:MAG: protein of unknown function DUF891 [Gammaproteobacteria bacterium]|nr:protein of unknown function DUF891 [Gammaproteobacteria bacterium]
MDKLKPITWLGTSREDLREFPGLVRQKFGTELMSIQLGFDPADWKPMTNIGQGVKEIRVQHEGQYRVIYIAKYRETIYVLHAFRKKTQRTARQDIALVKNRLKLIKR